ncbi:hypothetical protein QVD17_36429 [Tagetes erecta]|uniref:Uncharacterized protein n=1 Tax=Tagetes erecta TaxID=13708 RepID=A0AAD8JYJ9_TARER|nr:hypothetical protein QVD17_36429 [Tagetes erecta]
MGEQKLFNFNTFHFLNMDFSINMGFGGMRPQSTHKEKIEMWIVVCGHKISMLTYYAALNEEMKVHHRELFSECS